MPIDVLDVGEWFVAGEDFLEWLREIDALETVSFIDASELADVTSESLGYFDSSVDSLDSSLNSLPSTSELISADAPVPTEGSELRFGTKLPEPDNGIISELEAGTEFPQKSPPKFE